jgi:hypothetical protein
VQFTAIDPPDDHVTLQKLIIQFLAMAVLLIGASLLVDFARVMKFVYPEIGYWPVGVALLIFVASPLFVLGVAVARLVKKQFVLGVALIALCGIPFLMPKFGDGPYWKFRVNKADYLWTIASDPSSAPKYRVFHWEDEEIASGWIRRRAIVYDESDEIAREPEARSPEWLARRANPPWFTEPGWIVPACKIDVTPFGGHFITSLEAASDQHAAVDHQAGLPA